MKKHFNRDIVFGTYLLSEWIEVLGSDNINDGIQLLKKNPFKYLTQLIMLGINTSAELNETGEAITMKDAFAIVDQNGGIGGDAVQSYLNDFFKSLEVGSTKGKKQAKAKK